jgi:endonuclease/exonuclease/phosphatase family metal-dependent hydrolase
MRKTGVKTRRKRGGGTMKKKSLIKLQQQPKPIQKPVRNPSFTIMTCNIESWLNLIKPVYNSDKSYDIEQTRAVRTAFKNSLQSAVKNETTIQRWQELKAHFSNVDILCIQEDALLGDANGADLETYKIGDEPQTNFIEKIGELDLVASCKSHPYTWPDTVGLFYPGSKLSNSIYSKYDADKLKLSMPAQLTVHGRETINNEGKIHPRCWAVSDIQIVENKPSIRVATIHLSGGRFDDIQSLHGNNYIIKIRQIMELIKREKPDIICGDLNTKLRPPDGEDTYFASLPKNEDTEYPRIDNWSAFYNMIYDHILNETPLPSNVSMYDKWQIWMYGLDYIFRDDELAKRLRSFPYESAENDKDTTIFGGIVDMIYYNPQRLDCIQSGAVDGFIAKGQRILSDHAPVKATFRLK